MGFPLGDLLDSNGDVRCSALSLPRDRLCRHCLISGGTGAGKTVFLTRAIHDLTHSTDGATVVITPKDGTMATAQLRSEFGSTGQLDHVYSFTPADVPALSVFDLEPLLAAGIPRAEAIQRIADQYLTIARMLMGGEQFDQAVSAADVIRALITAAFDQTFGVGDQFAHRELERLAEQLAAGGDPPAVSEAYVTANETLTDLADLSRESREAIVGGVKRRLRAVVSRPYLRTLFDYTAADATAEPFALSEKLNEDCLILVDLSRLSPPTRQAVSVVLLSKLWAALTKRKAITGAEDPPIVSVVLDEAKNYKDVPFFQELITEGRGYRVAVTLATQNPGQLARDGAAADPADAVLENVGTLLIGVTSNPGPALTQRLANKDHTPAEIATRLKTLPGGQWLVTTAGQYQQPPKGPFQTTSPELPPGHPESAYPLADSALWEPYTTALEQHREKMASYAINIEAQYAAADTSTDTQQPSGDLTETPAVPRGSVLTQTERLPADISYTRQTHRIVCESCEVSYAPSVDGMLAAIDCCHGEAIDRSTVPLIECAPPLTAAERIAAGVTPGQVCFMYLVYKLQYGHHDPRLFDLVDDSMVHLREYAGIDPEAVEQLREQGFVRKDTQRPHQVYSLTATGREALGIELKEGRDFGDGIGDLGESAHHRLGVRLTERYLTETYVADPDSPVVAVKPYYPLSDGTRLDVAAVDETGTIHVAAEIELDNNDHTTAAVSDYDKLTVADHALWVVENRACAESIVAALSDPSTGPARIEKTYNGTPPRQYTIDQPGFSEMVTITHLHGQVSHTETLSPDR